MAIEGGTRRSEVDGEARMRQLADALPQLVWTAGADGDIEFINARAGDYGLGDQPDGARIAGELVHPEDRERVFSAWRAAKTGTTGAELEARLAVGGGAHRWHVLQAIPLGDEPGARWMGIATDVHELREMQVQLARDSERLRRTLEGLDAIVAFRASDEPASISPQVERILGIKPGAVADEAAWRALVHPEDQAAAAKAWDDPSDTWSAAYRMRRADGAWIWVRDHGRRTRNADGRWSAYSVVTDITEYRTAAEGVIRAARLESLGRLASGVAHDFENVLYGIGTLASWIAAHPDHADVKAEAANIVDAANAGQAMTQALLAFAQGGGTERRPLDPVAFVRETTTLLEPLLGPEVTLRVDLPAKQPRVVVDRAGFTQALINLSVNARDAMPDGGTLSIELAGRRLDAKQARTLDVAPGRYVCLTVADTGDGISADVIDHVFEPFFTTKPMNLGTGLGLSTTYGFVRANAGAVSVESIRGRGTTFRIFLPAW